MDITQVQDNIKGQILDRKQPSTGPKWTLSFRDDTKSSGLTFGFLGAGTNKIVFHIFYQGKPMDWVLCFQGNESARPEVAKADFEGEINTLVRLGNQHVVVPRPFPIQPPSPDFLFQFVVDNFESGSGEKPVYAFIIEYFDLKDRYVEMDKKDKDPGSFLKNKCLTTPDAKENLARTIDTFQAIQAAWAREAWNDFQVLYDKTDGTLMVFDPMPKVVDKEKIDKVLAQWEADLKAASTS